MSFVFWSSFRTCLGANVIIGGRGHGGVKKYWTRGREGACSESCPSQTWISWPPNVNCPLRNPERHTKSPPKQNSTANALCINRSAGETWIGPFLGWCGGAIVEFFLSKFGRILAGIFQVDFLGTFCHDIEKKQIQRHHLQNNLAIRQRIPPHPIPPQKNSSGRIQP